MASYKVKPQFITQLVDSLQQSIQSLTRSSECVESYFPQGLELKQAPEISEAIGRLTDFAAMVDARIQRARSDEMFGLSRKTLRDKKRRSTKAKNK